MPLKCFERLGFPKKSSPIIKEGKSELTKPPITKLFQTLTRRVQLWTVMHWNKTDVPERWNVFHFWLERTRMHSISKFVEWTKTE